MNYQLNIMIAGGLSFKNQVKNRIQDLYREGRFLYTEVAKDAQIVISEEDAFFPKNEYPGIYVYIEVLKSPEGKLVAAQSVAGKKTDSFGLKDLPSVLQGSIFMVQLLMERDMEISTLKKNVGLWEDQESHIELNYKNAQKVQRYVMNRATKISGYETEFKYLPKSVISGDFVVTKKIFDKVFIFFGDVTDHGVYAAEYAASLVSLAENYLDSCSKFNADIRSFMSYMSRAAFYYHGDNEQSSCECIFCEINEKRDLVNFCTFSGGNITPIVISQNGEIKQVFNDSNVDVIKPRMGDFFYKNNNDFEDLPKIVTIRNYKKGDSILFYTDGFSELFSIRDAVKDQKNTYGGENMVNAVRDACERGDNSPSTIVNAVVNDIVSYGVAGLDENALIENMIVDDATMFCIRRKADV